MNKMNQAAQVHDWTIDMVPAPLVCVSVNYQILAVNNAFVTLVGNDKDTLLGQPLRQQMNKASWFAMQNMLAAAIEQGQKVEQYSMRLLTTAGDLIPVLVSAEQTGSVINIVCVPYDNRINFERSLIAKRSEAAEQVESLSESERRLRHKQQEKEALISKLENVSGEFLQTEKMAAIGQLAAGVAHEINNPIGYVYSNLQTLAGYLDDLRQIIEAIDQVEHISELKELKQTLDYEFLRTDVTDLLRESAEGIERVKQIITALKDFSRKDDFELQPCDLHKAIETTLSVAWNEIKYKAEVHREFADIPNVVCHLGQINQVLMNLLVNAAQSIEHFGMITITTGSEGQWVWIQIEDNGHGINAEHLPRIFEPFYTTKPVGEGTGLGLALAYNIVRKHGGELRVDSSREQGTAFTLWLPIAGPKGMTE
ncbi:MAG: PAS domain-containing protein [Idiomarina sp.]|nr:PAS domain-containing protein [Idiomarina sp.]